MKERFGLCVADWICMRLSICIISVAVIASRVLNWIRRCRCNRKLVFVYANDLLGDTIVKLPFFFSLRREFPSDQYHIAVVLSPAMAGLIDKLALFDEIIVEAPLHWRHPLFWLVGRTGIARSLRWAFFHRAEVMIVCHRSRSLGCDFALRLCTPSVSVAYAADVKTPMLPVTAHYQAESCDGLYTHLLVSEDGRHQMEDMDKLLSLARGRHVKSCLPEPKDIMAMLDFSFVQPGEAYMVLVPGARVAYRRWPIANFVAIAKKFHVKIVVVGSNAEAALASEISKGVDRDVVNLCGKTTLPQLGGVLAQAKLVITNETGTATYSAMLGAKTVCILGGGDFGAFFPNQYCTNAVCVFHRDACFNCGWNCTKHSLVNSAVAPCIESVAVEDVCAAVQRLQCFACG